MATSDDKLLRGTPIANDITKQLKEKIDAFIASHPGHRRPGLATIVVGDEDGSRAYVAMKTKACATAGIDTIPVELPREATQSQLLSHIAQLNADPRVDGILLQLPLPPHMDQFTAVEAISPMKDVDGLTSSSAGLMILGKEDKFVTCTPAGIIVLLEKSGFPIRGANVVIVNHSTVVGRPLGQLLLNRGATVTICHIDTKDLAFHTVRADVLVTAVGKPGLITGNMIKEGAVVIDAGYARVNGKVYGDVVAEEIAAKASKYTPAVGGVGPMTIAMLLSNTVKSFDFSFKNH